MAFFRSKQRLNVNSAIDLLSLMIRDLQCYGKVFGLSKTRIQHCVDQLTHALDQWESCAENAGASEKDTIAVKKFFHF